MFFSNNLLHFCFIHSIQGSFLLNRYKESFILVLFVLIIGGVLTLEYNYVASLTIKEEHNILSILEYIKYFIAVVLLFVIYIFYLKNKASMTTLKQLQEALDKTNIISKTDLKGKITFVNQKFIDISGYEESELVGKNHNIVRHPEMPKDVFKKMWQTIKNKETFHAIIKNKTKDGQTYFVDSTIMPLLNSDGKVVEYIGIRHEIGDIINPATKLMEDIKNKENPCLIIVKIANYDTLLDLYPHEILENLEQIFTKEILYLLPEGLELDYVYHLANGEFAFLKEMEMHKNIVHTLSVLLEKFQQNINQHRIKINNLEYDIKCVISFSNQKENILEDTKIGLLKAKNASVQESIVYAKDLSKASYEKAVQNLKTISMIEIALEKNKIVSYFQAIMNNHTNEIEKYESLIRLIDEEENVISPFFFMDVSKKAALYNKLTEKVIENSFKVVDDFGVNITLNLSALDIENVHIRNLLLHYITNSKYYGKITFELLEDETIKEFNLIKDFISLSKIMGDVQIAIDDFGSGYSNYERLLDFQPDILKIDGSLIKGIANNKSNQNIVRSIVSFAKSENIKTVAEFVSDQETLDFVKEIGIDYSQGFHIGKPQPMELEK